MRFLFPTNIFYSNSPIKIYRFKVVVFGASCSPFLLSAVVSKHIEDHIKDQSMRKSFRNIYVDNFLVTKKTEEELLDFYHVSRDLFKKAGMDLCQWRSNSPLVEEAAKEDGVWNSSDRTKILGQYWVSEQGQMEYKADLKQFDKYTKRITLRFGNQIYDRYGFIVPIEIRCRLITKKLWKLKLGWDHSFRKNKDLKEEWDDIVEENLTAIKARFPRRLYLPSNVQLHIISDASMVAYGAVVYFVIPKSREFPYGLAQIVYAKGKITKQIPKEDTIPKLEMMGVTLAAQCIEALFKGYPDTAFDRKVLWCDNRSVLEQLSSVRNRSTFVHNRVVNIRSWAEGFEIRHIAGKENPADMITRPVRAQKLLTSERWWKGPAWLKDPALWDLPNIYVLNPEIIDDEPKEHQLQVAAFFCNLLAKVVKPDVACLWKNFITYEKNICFFAILNFMKLRAKKIPFEGKVQNPETGKFDPITQREYAEGERLALRTMQKEYFPREIERLKLGRRICEGPFAQLKLYLDKYGIIRCHGRLKDKNFAKVNSPVLFPPRHPLTILYIQSQHKCYNCMGVTSLLNKVRRFLHCIRLRSLIVEILKNCIICQKILARPYHLPEHPPLDVYRTECKRPFSMCGCDYVGPHDAIPYSEDGRDRGKESYKIYGVIFTCLVSRAVYQAIVPNRSAIAFLRVFRELTARHTEPKVLITDNEGAFKATNAILQAIAENPTVRDKFAKRGIEWKFIPSRASWMGGIYERVVGMFKKELVKMQHKVKFNEYEWRAHYAEIEAILNDRPLTYVTEVGSEPEVVTPKAIIHGCVEDQALGSDINTDRMMLEMKRLQNNPIELYRENIKAKNQFWKNLTDNYLMLLRFARYKSYKNKGLYTKTKPKEGTIVMIYDTDLRLGWQMGVVHELIRSSDGQIRKADVKTFIRNTNPNSVPKTRIRRKAINHLIPLELQVESYQEMHPEEAPHIILDDQESNDLRHDPNVLDTQPIEDAAEEGQQEGLPEGPADIPNELLELSLEGSLEEDDKEVEYGGPCRASICLIPEGKNHYKKENSCNGYIVSVVQNGCIRNV